MEAMVNAGGEGAADDYDGDEDDGDVDEDGG